MRLKKITNSEKTDEFNKIFNNNKIMDTFINFTHYIAYKAIENVLKISKRFLFKQNFSLLK